MTQSSNGQPLPQSKRHSAKLCPIAIRQRIVNALANGDSIRAIARALRVSNNTVVAIRDQDWQQVAARKERIAAQHERAASTALDLINDELERAKPGQISLPVLNVVAGTSSDKLSALRGDSVSTIKHIHSIEISDSDIVAFALMRSKQLAKADVIDVALTPAPALTPTLDFISSRRKRGAKGPG